MSWYQKKHSATDTYSGHQSPLICFFHLLRHTHTTFLLLVWNMSGSIFYDPHHTPCSIYVPDSLFPQSLSKFSLVYLLAMHIPLHTPYISSPTHCLLFAAHAQLPIPSQSVLLSTKIMSLCHLIVVSLNLLLGTLSCGLMPHIHLTILISARSTSFSFLRGHVSLPCIILLCTQNRKYATYCNVTRK